ncbi:phage major capsid protein [Oleiharenicola lentus]|uniref:phage major capsid protein n=1 Tax=Oleiharenicola lentus TaxID=2508720 RepID=UPI003F680B0B
MKSSLKLCGWLFAGSLLTAATGWSADAPKAGGDDRVRAALRETTLQLRTAQGELATVQAAQVTLTEEKRVLAEKFEVLKKQSLADRTESDRELAALKKQLAALTTGNDGLKVALTKASAHGEQTSGALREAEGKITQLTSEKNAWERRAADRQAKNLALFLTGNEILTRYEEFGLGTAIRAKEPFVGTMRAKLETLVQDYRDKLLDQKTEL